MLIFEAAFVLLLMIAFLLTKFIIFHIQIALSNKTTIETLGSQTGPFLSPYDIGFVNNWVQIFGTSMTMWPFPIQYGDGKPLGDGIIWNKNNTQDDGLEYTEGEESESES